MVNLFSAWAYCLRFYAPKTPILFSFPLYHFHCNQVYMRYLLATRMVKMAGQRYPHVPPPPSTSLSTYNLSCARFTLDEVKIRKPTRNTKSESASNRILIVMNKKLARLSSIGRTYSISFNSSNVSIFFLGVSS